VSLPAIRTAAMGAVAAVLVGGVVACSSSTAPAEPTGTATPSPSRSAAAAPSGTEPAPGHDAFAQCLTDNGVPAPPKGAGHRGSPQPDGTGAAPGGPPPSGAPPHDHAGGGAPPGVDPNTWNKAMQACSSLAPAGPRQ
jgi:hypothetical protein